MTKTQRAAILAIIDYIDEDVQEYEQKLCRLMEMNRKRIKRNKSPISFPNIENHIGCHLAVLEGMLCQS